MARKEITAIATYMQVCIYFFVQFKLNPSPGSGTSQRFRIQAASEIRDAAGAPPIFGALVSIGDQGKLLVLIGVFAGRP